MVSNAENERYHQIMSSNAKNSATPADAKAAEDKKNATVPQQSAPEATEEVTTEETASLTVLEGGKKSLKQRVASVNEKLKANKKIVFAVGVALSAASFAFAKYAKQQALQDAEGETAVDESVEPDDNTESAA